MSQICNSPAYYLLAGTIAVPALLPVAFAEAATETALYSFCSQTNCADGEAPAASLINVKGTLYGTTYSGGLDTYCNSVYYDGCGAVFSIDLNTGAETTLYSFCSEFNCPDGAYPLGGLINLKGLLYGTTTWGGTSGDGTVYVLDPITGAEAVLHSFCRGCGDGDSPQGDLTELRGQLYGITDGGGEFNYGTVFSIDPKSGAETVVYSFGSNITDGVLPEAGVIDVKGMLYGTTSEGGIHDGGAAFVLDSTTGMETVLYSFAAKPTAQMGHFPGPD